MTDNTRPAPDADAATAVADALRGTLAQRYIRQQVAEVAVRALTAQGWRPPAPGTVTVNADDLRAVLDLSDITSDADLDRRREAYARLRAALGNDECGNGRCCCGGCVL